MNGMGYATLHTYTIFELSRRINDKRKHNSYKKTQQLLGPGLVASQKL